MVVVENVERYLTFWTLLISWIIILMALVTPLPRWMVLFAGALLVAVTTVATWYLSIPSAVATGDPDTMYHDMVHILPFLLFIAVSPFLRTYGQSTTKTFLVTLAVTLLYLTIYATFGDLWLYEVHLRSERSSTAFSAIFILIISMYCVAYYLLDKNLPL